MTLRLIYELTLNCMVLAIGETSIYFNEIIILLPVSPKLFPYSIWVRRFKRKQGWVNFDE